MKSKILGLLAIVAAVVPMTTQASYVYTMRSNCIKWTVVSDSVETERGCPAQFTGRAVMPDTYVPGTTISWGRDDDSVLGFMEIDHPYFGNRARFTFAEADGPGYITLPVLAGEGAFNHEGPTWAFWMSRPGLSDLPEGAVWRWTNEVEGGGTTYYGGPLVFRRVPEPGTLALLGLGLAGLGLSRRRKAA